MATPNEILDGNGCFSCLDDSTLLKLTTILLYQISGSSMTPSELLESEPCFACLPDNMQKQLQTILLAVIANSGNANGEHFTGSGSPEGVVTASTGALYLDTTNLQIYHKFSGVNTNTGWL